MPVLVGLVHLHHPGREGGPCVPFGQGLDQDLLDPGGRFRGQGLGHRHGQDLLGGVAPQLDHGRADISEPPAGEIHGPDDIGGMLGDEPELPLALPESAAHLGLRPDRPREAPVHPEEDEDRRAEDQADREGEGQHEPQVPSGLTIAGAWIIEEALEGEASGQVAQLRVGIRDALPAVGMHVAQLDQVPLQ